MFWRPLCFALGALLAGCSSTEVGPAPSTAAVAPPAVAPAHTGRCRSNADCAGSHARDLCVPRAITKELSDAEELLRRAMGLYNLITRLGDASSSSPLATIRQRVRDDMSKYSRIARGRGEDGSSAIDPGIPLTSEQTRQMQDAAWMQSGATQADMIIRQFWRGLSAAPITTEAEHVYGDITGDSSGLHLERVIDDLKTFLRAIEVVAAPVNQLITLRESDGSALTPRSGAGALLIYLAPLMEQLNDATKRVNALLDPSAIGELQTDLAILSREHDRLRSNRNAGTCLGSP